MGLSKEMDLRIRFEGLDIESLRVLDLGCGYNTNRIARTVLALPFRHLTSVDIHSPCLDALRDRPVAAREHSIVHSEILSYLTETEAEFDVALMLDVLEHFASNDVAKLLGAIEAVTCKRIIVFLPIGKCPYGTSDDNPYQAHRTTWEARDLLQLGFEVELLPGFHKQFHPPLDAAWAVKNL